MCSASTFLIGEPVSGDHEIRSRYRQFRVVVIADAVRPRVVGLRGEALGSAVLERQHQPVVEQMAAIIQLRNAAVIQPVNGILQIENAAGVHVTDGRTAGDVHAGVGLIAAPQVHDMRAQVVGLRQPIRADLPLNTHVPLLGIGGLRIQQEILVRAELDEGRVFADAQRIGVAARLISPGIGELAGHVSGGKGYRRLAAERRRPA